MTEPVFRLARGTSVLLAQFLVASAALAQAAPAAPKPAAPNDAASYSLGLTVGEQLRNGGLADSLSMDGLMRGIREAVNGKVLTSADKEAAVQFLKAGREVVAGRNKAAAREFLARNAKEEGVVSTSSGLQYKVVAAGDARAAAPGPEDTVTVNYRGRLLDGTDFDSSSARGGPASFQIGQVIKGWGEALLLMKPGAKWQLFIPPELAYDAYSPPTIPPGSLLVMEVELVKVTPPGPVPAG